MTAPVTLAAIDAGSNAIRAVIATATSATVLETVFAERLPVRLGHRAFTRGDLDAHTVEEAVGAFARFKKLFDEHNVTRYRAVATSAARSARNGDMLVRRVDHDAGVELEIIDGDEEARLGRKAIAQAFRERRAPNLVIDLGGGSLEVDVRRADGWDVASLPVGTVRLIETLGLAGAISDEESRMIRRNTATLLKTFVETSIDTPVVPAAACGGNVEALAQILNVLDDDGMPAIELEDLEGILPEILGADVPSRMKLYGVSQNRAEVLGAAAIVLATVGAELNLRRLSVPGVGIREGILLDLAEQIGPGAAGREQTLLNAARAFAARVSHDTAHGEHVRKIARSLFDQLYKVHELPEDLSIVLEVAALLHDVGEVVHRRGHHKHGEYIIRWARIPGLDSPAREMVAALVRTHRKAPPDPKKHEVLAQLPKELQKHVRKLAAILRLADGFDLDRRQRVRDVRTRVEDGAVHFDVTTKGPGGGLADLVMRKADLFETELRRTVSISVTPRAAVLASA